jgi:hypothetical protein
MFFANNILGKKGPLGGVWLAAHSDDYKRLTKQQIFQTDVNRSVENIMNPTIPLALRLSGHLLLGVCRIHSRQVQYLVFDCEDAFTKINYSFRPGQVDLPEGPQVSQSSITLQVDADAMDRTMFSTAFLDGIDELYATQHSFTRLPRAFTPTTPRPNCVPSTIVPADRITLADTSAIRRSLHTPDDLLPAGIDNWDEDFELPTPEMARREAVTPASAEAEMPRSNVDLPADDFDVAMAMGFDEPSAELEPEADRNWRVPIRASAEPSALERATDAMAEEASPLQLDQTPVVIDADITWKLPKNSRKRQASPGPRDLLFLSKLSFVGNRMRLVAVSLCAFFLSGRINRISAAGDRGRGDFSDRRRDKGAVARHVGHRAAIPCGGLLAGHRECDQAACTECHAYRAAASAAHVLHTRVALRPHHHRALHGGRRRRRAAQRSGCRVHAGASRSQTAVPQQACLCECCCCSLRALCPPRLSVPAESRVW